MLDSGSEMLSMASGDLDCKPLCEKEEERSASAAIKTEGKLLEGSSIVSVLKD